MNKPTVIFDEDLTFAWIKTRGFYDSITGIDYRKVTEEIKKQFYEQHNEKEYRLVRIHSIRKRKMVYSPTGLRADFLMPLDSTDLKIEDYIECQINIEEATP